MYIYIYLLVDIDTEETNITTSVRSISPTSTPYNSQQLTLYATFKKKKKGVKRNFHGSQQNC